MQNLFLLSSYLDPVPLTATADTVQAQWLPIPLSLLEQVCVCLFLLARSAGVYPNYLTAKKHGFLTIFLFYALSGSPYSFSDLELPVNSTEILKWISNFHTSKLLYVLNFQNLTLNFKKSSKFFSAWYKNPSNLLILRQAACIESFLPICWCPFIWWKIHQRDAQTVFWAQKRPQTVLQHEIYSYLTFWRQVYTKKGRLEHLTAVCPRIIGAKSDFGIRK